MSGSIAPLFNLPDRLPLPDLRDYFDLPVPPLSSHTIPPLCLSVWAPSVEPLPPPARTPSAQDYGHNNGGGDGRGYGGYGAGMGGMGGLGGRGQVYGAGYAANAPPPGNPRPHYQ